MNLIECKNVEDLLNKISPGGGVFKKYIYPKSFIFRGQANSDWKLVPSALRETITNPKGVLGYNKPIKINERNNLFQIAYEIREILDFFKQADFSGLSIPEDSQNLRNILQFYEPVTWTQTSIFKASKFVWPPNEIWSLLAVAQHHGILTSLLDWTWSSYTAAYFSAIDNTLNHNKNGNPEFLSIWAFYVGLKHEYDIGDGNIHIIESPYAPNRNLLAQLGVHTLFKPKNYKNSYLETELNSNELDEALEKAVIQERTQGNFEPLIKFTFPAEKSNELLWELARMHVSAASLFPGYDGVVKSLKEKEIWNKWLHKNRI